MSQGRNRDVKREVKRKTAKDGEERRGRKISKEKDQGRWKEREKKGGS